MADNIPMTRAGAEAIKRELKKLKSVDRPKNVHDIAVAREHGDLRENAEYHAAKERQSHLDGRINMLEDRRARAQGVERARPYAGELEPRLDRLAESARRFDAATEEGRHVEVAALVGELSRLLDIPDDIAALAKPGGAADSVSTKRAASRSTNGS